jgi:type II secretory pathway predicted ATPase ExeA
MTTDATRFGLRRRPFPNTPDASCYYPATSHEKALARLRLGLAEGEGVLLLLGEPGTGKTLLCHSLLERLGGSVHSAAVTNSHLKDRAALLQAILYDLALPYQGRSEQEMRLALTEHLLQSFAAGGPTLLLIDEAHHLTLELLEELRLLGNLESGGGRALQIVLIGQSSLADKLRQPALASLRQRIAIRAELQPLETQEAADYLLHHLRLAGARPDELFSDEALETLARACGGVPRLLNQAAHQCLAVALEAGLTQVDAEVALEALSVLGLEDAEAVDAGPRLATEGGEPLPQTA